MIDQRHLSRLRALAAEAPSSLYDADDITLHAGRASITLVTEDEDRDVSGRVDRALYFKLLQDSAALAAGSLVEDRLVACESFNLYVARPITDGVVTALAQVVSSQGTLFTVEALLVDEGGRKLAGGHGVFARSPVELPDLDGEPVEEAAPDDASGVAYGAVWVSPYGPIHQN